jgi:hypothetical protein
MNIGDSRNNKKVGLSLAAGVLVASAVFVVLVIVVSRMTSSRPKFEEVYRDALRKNELVSTMRINLHASVEAEKSAVLAETDDESRHFADQAVTSSAAVEQAREEIAQLIEAEKLPKEMDLLREFNGCWDRFEEIDRALLPLAVQNTNLKALSLSFGPASDAIKRMESALTGLIDSSSSSAEASRIVRVSFEALTAAVKIQANEAPHIAEVSDAKMDEIEAAMNKDDLVVDNCLNTLAELVGAAGKPSLDAARAAYADFEKINSEVIRLSRENSNVRSLALSLGQKRRVTAQCEEILSALHDAVQTTRFKATK